MRSWFLLLVYVFLWTSRAPCALVCPAHPISFRLTPPSPRNGGGASLVGTNYTDRLCVRSHSHDSSFMHSDVSLFYSYKVVAETHFVIVTVPLVSLVMPLWGV
jgi:hypothetical protein